MKNIITLAVVFLFALTACGQENNFTLSGGYAFTNVEDNDVSASGWRINGLYEYNPMQIRWAHGFSFGFIKMSAEVVERIGTTNIDMNTWPLYYAPKYLFGGEKFKGFIKGAIGWQISNYDKSGPLSTLSDSDTGFLGGGGAGVNYRLNGRFFLSAEYELLYLSNSFYKDGLLNTASLGAGIKF